MLQEDEEALADLLTQLVQDHPDSPLVADLAQVFDPEPQASAGGSPVDARLQALDLNTLTPMAAFTLVAELKTLADGETQ